MDQVLQQIVLERLDQAALREDAKLLVLAACEGVGELASALGGQAPPRPDSVGAGSEVDPAGAYLGPVCVEGFRGIGPEATLGLVPGPGLTLVVGRNGSGKSSFAEALELLLTEDTRRWSQRSAIWKEGWRNVHHLARTQLRAELVVDGQAGATRVVRTWEAGDDLAAGAAVVQRPGGPRTDLETLGWRRELVRYRPFLSYNELGTMFDAGPTKLYETLALVLGLEELTDAEKALKTARLERSHLVETVADDLEKLRADLEVVDDERARRCLAAVAGRCLAAVAGRAWDLDEVADMLAGGPSTAGDLGRIDVLNGLRALAAPEREAVVGVVARLRAADEQLERVAGTDADRARRTARLLDDALALHATHGDGDCPVCGRTGALTAAWREEAEAEVRALRQQAADAEAAERAARDARQDGHALLARVPSILDRGPSAGVDTAPLAAAWTRWAEGCDLEELVPLADHLETSHAVLAAHIADVKEAARAELARREDRWRPVAVRLTVWLVRAREAVAAKAAVADLKVAETWLAEAAGTIRNERFAPIAGEALTNWRLLRHDPNVDVEEVVFAGKGVRRHVQLGVTVDGVGSAALGVMSQGELHALALSLFLPRAMLPESPFRFVVIDDPVQSMDPARVDGLARVLERAAAGRQVVVFTHDDRLPDAVRRLGIDSRVIEVTREAQSIVHLRPALDPVRRYLEDAMALARTDDLPTDVAMRVVPTFCRLAIESACTEVARRRRLARGVPHGKVEADLVALRTITQRAAVALFDDETCGGKVLGSLNTRFGRWAGDTFMVVKQGAHQGWNGDLPGLVDGTRRLTARVREL